MAAPPPSEKDAQPANPKPVATPVKGLVLDPAVEGDWRWESEARLTFRPVKPWPADMPYSVKLTDQVELNPGVRLTKREYSFRTAALTARVGTVEFYTDPTNPETHQVVGELLFSHPMKQADVERHVQMTVVGSSPLFTKNGKTPSSLFTLVPDEKDSLRHFWARSVPLTIPVKEDFVVVTITPGMVIDGGGKPMEKEAAGRVRVPDVSSGLAIEEVRGDILRNDEGEPAQFLFVKTKGFVTLETLAAAMEVKLLPPKSEEEPEWQSLDEVTPQILAKAKPVKFKAEPAEEKYVNEHAFRMEAVAPGQLYISIRKGLRAWADSFCRTTTGCSSAHRSFPAN